MCSMAKSFTIYLHTLVYVYNYNNIYIRWYMYIFQVVNDYHSINVLHVSI